MFSDEEVYQKIFFVCKERLDNEEKPVRENLVMALDKTLCKIKEGKLSPATFPVLIAKDLNREDLLPLAYELAAVCAFFHTSADLVDDVQDDSKENPVINKVGKAQAINISNKLLFISQQLILKLRINKKKKLELLNLFNQSGNIMSTGQFFDLAYTNKLPEQSESLINEIELIAERKVGAEFSCFLSCFIVAIGGSPETYYNLGIYYGALAQVVTDYYDILCNPFSDDISVLKCSLPIYSFCKNPEFAEEARLALAGKNDLIKKQFEIKRILSKVKAEKDLKRYFDVCKSNVDKMLEDLPNSILLREKIYDTYQYCTGIIAGLEELKGYMKDANSRSTLIDNIDTDLDKARIMALEHVTTDSLFRDTWEIQRWGFLDEPLLLGNLFTPALILETLLETNVNIDATLKYLLSLKGEKGWHYYTNTTKIPTDTDDLGQLLSLVGKIKDFKSYSLFHVPLKLLELNIEASGKCPTWIFDQDLFQQEDIEKKWFGNECIAVMSNLYHGLYQFDKEKYKELILKGISYILSKFDKSQNGWVGTHYKEYFTFYQVSRLLNTVNIKHKFMELAKNKILKEQRLDGSWNSSPQDTTFALLGLLTFNDIDPLVIKSGLIFLKDSQKYDGGWDGEDLFICPGIEGRYVYYKNSKVTTSFCLRAIIQGKNKLKNPGIKKLKAAVI